MCMCVRVCMGVREYVRVCVCLCARGCVFAQAARKGIWLWAPVNGGIKA